MAARVAAAPGCALILAFGLTGADSLARRTGTASAAGSATAGLPATAVGSVLVVRSGAGVGPAVTGVVVGTTSAPGVDAVDGSR